MASDECQGKSSWPELLRTNGETAAATIERENLNVNAQIISDQAVVLPVVDCTRVWVRVNTDGIVTQVPIVG
ncbi:hypothetical protein J1N35_029629 [Gossypium stocksii]|uniref:Uncharacterized protein n=1 Tax=Gossypium stocksii TaxID=47602 RepID=A0A9D3ZTE1_9ROSI|nr:hypothetical protein J1N35_029629 [Gossypium stocksii]